MSDIRFNSWYHQSGTGGIHQDGSGNIGIGTTVPTAILEVVGSIKADTITADSISGVVSGFATDVSINTTGIITASNLTAGDVNVTGIITASNLTAGDVNVTGIITASSFVGDGSNITGIAGIEGVPAGSMIYSFASSPPSGFLKANGATISRTTYADLFAAIGTQYGAGDGSTTFQLPDLRGEFIRGWDDSRGVDSGRSFGSAQTDELKSHTHNYYNIDSSAAAGSSGVRTNAGSGRGTATTSTGGTETRPRNVALLACIKY